LRFSRIFIIIYKQSDNNINKKDQIMMRCSKTGLSDKDWTTILDVVNVFDPNDIAHVYPDMGTPEFMQDVQSAFKAVLAHVEHNNLPKTQGGKDVPHYGPTGKDSTKPAAVDHMSLAYQQWVHDS
jgi:hypothetical protein